MRAAGGAGTAEKYRGKMAAMEAAAATAEAEVQEGMGC